MKCHSEPTIFPIAISFNHFLTTNTVIIKYFWNILNNLISSKYPFVFPLYYYSSISLLSPHKHFIHDKNFSSNIKIPSYIPIIILELSTSAIFPIPIDISTKLEHTEDPIPCTISILQRSIGINRISGRKERQDFSRFNTAFPSSPATESTLFLSLCISLLFQGSASIPLIAFEREWRCGHVRSSEVEDSAAAISNRIN